MNINAGVALAQAGLHSDGRTTKGRATYNRTTNYRTKVRWSVSCLDLCAVV